MLNKTASVKSILILSRTAVTVDVDISARCVVDKTGQVCLKTVSVEDIYDILG